jgi:hypothetical protein
LDAQVPTVVGIVWWCRLPAGDAEYGYNAAELELQRRQRVAEQKRLLQALVVEAYNELSCRTLCSSSL